MDLNTFVSQLKMAKQCLTEGLTILLSLEKKIERDRPKNRKNARID